MPLHSHDEVVGGCAFQSFDDPVRQTSGYDTKSLACDFCRLMMTRIDGHLPHERGARAYIRPAFTRFDDRRDNSGESRARLDLNRMRDAHTFPCLVVDRRFDVLKQSAATINIQTLQAIANAEDWLARLVCVLQQ